jgi:hypothetical protein
LSLAPIAAFVHARPAHTRRMIKSLQANPAARNSDLFVFADAPKKPEQAQAVRDVREIVRGIEGFASVTLIERERNLGLSGSITDGITKLCAERGRVIAVEDDLVVAPGFLDFLNRGLDHYADLDRVFQISGYMYPGQYGERDAFFLPMISCWGWATWKRAWAHYDGKMSGFEKLTADESLRRRFNLNGAYDYFSMASQQYSQALDSWGIRWHLSVFLKDGLVLYPPTSLVQNAGTDGSGTHGTGHAQLQRTLENGSADIRFPDRIVADEKKLGEVEVLLRSMKPNIARRVVSWLLH